MTLRNLGAPTAAHASSTKAFALLRWLHSDEGPPAPPALLIPLPARETTTRTARSTGAPFTFPVPDRIVDPTSLGRLDERRFVFASPLLLFPCRAVIFFASSLPRNSVTLLACISRCALGPECDRLGGPAGSLAAPSGCATALFCYVARGSSLPAPFR